MYPTVFSDFVLATQGINSALSSLAKGLSKGTIRQIRLDPVVWDGGREGQGPEEHYVLVHNIYPSGHCQVRSVEASSKGERMAEPVMNYMCIHPCTEAVRKEEVIQEGLSHLSPPLSTGKWGLPVRFGAGVQQWALSSPAASGKETVSLAKTLSPFLGHPSVISSSPFCPFCR